MNKYKNIAASIFLGLILVACGASEQPEPDAFEQPKVLADYELIPRKSFFGDPDLWQGRISPDGTRVSYIAPVDGVKNV